MYIEDPPVCIVIIHSLLVIKCNENAIRYSVAKICSTSCWILGHALTIRCH